MSIRTIATLAIAVVLGLIAVFILPILFVSITRPQPLRAPPG